MRHLNYHLFGIILLSSFGSAFGVDDYDPRQDVFDQIINALVPTLIVFLFDAKKSEDEKDQINSRNSKDLDEEKAENSDETTTHKSSIFDKVKQAFVKIRRELSLVKIKRAFDDFIFLLSLFVLPSVVFYKNRMEFATPLWISTLFGVTAGFVFIILMCNYIFSHRRKVIAISAIAIDLSHVISDICFIFYTKNIPASNFTDVFIYLHAITGILGTISLIFYVIWLIMYFVHNHTAMGGECFKTIYYTVFFNIDPILRKITIIITFICTPVVQMLNMALLSGNDYYWTKSILALNLIYLSRVLNYAGEKVVTYEAQFGVLHNIFHFVRKTNSIGLHGIL